jgi:uncharacterized protein
MKRIPKWNDALKADFCRVLHDEKRPEGTFDYIFLDGFVRAMCSAPAVLSPVSWANEVFCKKEPNFADKQEASPYYAGLFALYNHQMEQVIEGECQFPIDTRYAADPKKRQPIERWCAGFLHGHKQAEKIWDEMMALYPEPDIETSITMDSLPEQLESILDLVSIVADSDAAVKDGTDAATLDKTFAALGKNIILYGLIGQALLIAESEASEDGLDDDLMMDDGLSFEKIKHPIKRDVPKVGRNDPCPCGSGKKYKNCCLA